MKVTATELANDSKGILDRVIARGAVVQVKRHGKSVAQIRRTVGVSGAELLKRLKSARFTAAEQRELKTAMSAASKVFGHAGSH
ncbi:MAG: hypothetical protein EPO07_14335 [Verrucomicrobia bacterium]|nr:MAG: hypothetical protein EPO07_14335 [Verrucomicrobiota bacterium]